MPNPSKTRQYSPSVNDQISGWRTYTRPDGSEYYAKHAAGEATRPSDSSSLHSAIVVDDSDLRRMADENVRTFNFSFEEIYFAKEQYLIVVHSDQTAYYSNQQIDVRRKRRLYWHYISWHSAHAAESLSSWLPEAHSLALVYLKWCTFEALTSSTAKIPFPLKQSQELTSILESLSEPDQFIPHSPYSLHVAPSRAVAYMTSEDGANLPSRNTGREKEGFILSHVKTSGVEKDQDQAPAAETLEADVGESSRPALVEEHLRNKDVPQSMELRMTVRDPAEYKETAAQESRKLRTALIAKVLTEKYNYHGAVDESGAADRRPESSKTLDVVFWVVDLASLGSFLRYLRRLDEVRASVTTDDQWRDHIMRFVKEWEEFNLISTVLLSASAGILALESIGGVPRTAILISILSSFASVTTGLYCISMYQLRAPDSRDSHNRTSALTIFNYNQYTLTHKGIAFVLGLPMAFLVWSLIAFMVGILSYNIVGTEIAGHVSGVAYAVISVSALVFLLIAAAFYSLSRLWGAGHIERFFRDVRRRYKKLRSRTLRRGPRKTEAEYIS